MNNLKDDIMQSLLDTPMADQNKLLSEIVSEIRYNRNLKIAGYLAKIKELEESLIDLPKI